ncbi:Crp/Fnr family transcriptional regulator [Aurantimonas coralicida]|uniref:Crp/Fnr family transcriptional regulator n=1 Tax=Aurantimonas coralicida TaxID=182270 RepID=UPI001D1984E1|nr:Crp/Fnr family transcriptional regulator [Aurantimonas coralicida]MCC4300313.1 Crp/Fnr family transcriptional regulator [Aurantimonas coralicida]
MNSQTGPIDLLIDRLHRASGINHKDLSPLRTLQVSTKEFSKNQTIAREGERLGHCILLLDGFLVRSLDTREGDRQILSFYVPGDIPDLLTLELPTMDHCLASISDAKVAIIPHAPLREICDSSSAITFALWRETLIDGAITRRWVRNLGRLQARERIAHVLCELYVRLDAVGLASEPIHLPVTQSDFADAMGLTPVSVNRAFKEFREEGVVTISRRELAIHDWSRLKHIAQFDPLYLHLPAEAGL